ncbi:DeoR/GlpR family DNA-binding transcription regulator [Taklimakanibacter lacteus]|uniref:DeoR/GlpR family DNA-binding transcription regulator n=1 Tax=Taklimakanibacter lacteus TaxID=2268456 RepID=UPI000E675479
MNRLSRRHAEIRQLLHDRMSASVTELSERLGVSAETIRRDLKLMAERGEVLKLHGAATLPHAVGEAPFERRMRENAIAKRAIARRAAEAIADGDSIMLDTGTTTSYLARELLQKRGLTVVTNSSDIARTLSTVNGNKVHMAGGELHGDNGAAFGNSAITFIERFNVRHAIITAGALDAATGVNDYDLAEAEFAATVLSRGERSVVVTDRSKFGRSALVNVCGFDQLDCLVTDAKPPDDLARALVAAGVAIEVATLP